MLCKLQYKTFEPGEFVNEQVVTYEEALKIIETFPWESEREKIVIDLTNPSVTFHSTLDFYLKLALYYKGKFVLHYFDGKHLYTKSLLRVTDGYLIIQEFFEEEKLDVSELRKESTILKRNGVHFISLDFRYSIAEKSTFQLVDNWTKLVLMFDVFLLTGNNLLLRVDRGLGTLIGLLIISFICGGINLLLFFNYKKYSNNKLLQLSRGSDFFLYGDITSPIKYAKSDIRNIIVVQNKSGQAPWSGYSVTYIIMKNLTHIVIPSLLVNEENIILKFPNINYVKKETLIPFIPKQYK